MIIIRLASTAERNVGSVYSANNVITCMDSVLTAVTEDIREVNVQKVYISSAQNGLEGRMKYSTSLVSVSVIDKINGAFRIFCNI